MKRSPNLLVLVSDQHRADVLGCAGHPVVRTPHLDRLAACGARAARARVRREARGVRLRRGARDGRRLANLAHPNAYADHLAARGLLDVYRRHVGARGYVRRAHDPPADYVDTWHGKQAADWIESYRGEKPFHLFVGFPGPHDPWDAPKEAVDRYRDAEILPPRNGLLRRLSVRAADRARTTSRRSSSSTASRIRPRTATSSPIRRGAPCSLSCSRRACAPSSPRRRAARIRPSSAPRADER